jgi:surfeit locus 1 family protein
VTSTVGHAPDYSFARKPKWVVSHLLVLALIVVMMIAGFWQIDRHNERGERNDLAADRSQLEPVPLRAVAPPGADIGVGEEEQFRRVVVTGEYRPEDEVLIRNRTYEGAPGWWVLTPFVTDDGWAVAINRGWIALAFEADEARPGTEPPTGTIEVLGSIQPARLAEGFQVADPQEGRLFSLGRPDVARLAAQVDYEMSPVVLRIEPVSTNEISLPIPLPLPALDAGPHLSYAAQWFIFTVIALIGYPLVLRQVSRGKAKSAPQYG